ncbi:hypothetical protein GJ496_002134, partial [Pomphorhynchus laevis]
ESTLSNVFLNIVHNRTQSAIVHDLAEPCTSRILKPWTRKSIIPSKDRISNEFVQCHLSKTKNYPPIIVNLTDHTTPHPLSERISEIVTSESDSEHTVVARIWREDHQAKEPTINSTTEYLNMRNNTKERNTILDQSLRTNSNVNFDFMTKRAIQIENGEFDIKNLNKETAFIQNLDGTVSLKIVDRNIFRVCISDSDEETNDKDSKLNESAASRLLRYFVPSQILQYTKRTAD